MSNDLTEAMHELYNFNMDEVDVLVQNIVKIESLLKIEALVNPLEEIKLRGKFKTLLTIIKKRKNKWIFCLKN